MKLFKLFFFSLLLTFAFSKIVFAADFTNSIENGIVKRYSIETEHFKIEFSDLIKNQLDTDRDNVSNIVENAADAAELSWDKQIVEMDYEIPSSQKLTLILDDNDEFLISGAVGITTVESDGVTPFMAIDPWTSKNLMSVTIAHEFFHAIQFGYNPTFASTYNGVAWAEASAVWMEDEVYEDVDDYVLYLKDFYNHSDYSVFASLAPSDTFFIYALSIWPKFLSEYFEDSDIVRNIWENYFDSSLDYYSSYKVYDAAVEAVEAKGNDFDETFQDFSLWNLDPSTFYIDGSEYPELYVESNTIQGEYTEISEDYVPALYGTNYLYFENENAVDSFYFHIVKPEGISFAVSIVPEDNGDAKVASAQKTIIEKNEEMLSELVLTGLEDYDGVYAVISPLSKEFANKNATDSVFDEGYLYYYLGNYGESLKDGEELEADETSTKEGEEATTESAQGETEVLALEIVNYDESSVTLGWNRLEEDRIDSYKIRYGLTSESYTKSKTIDKPYTTSTTISELETGSTYYFIVEALEDDGSKISKYTSEEIVVTPEEWVFEDVSFFNEYYDAIVELKDRGIFEGYPDGTFKVNNDINRAELLKILIEAQDLNPSVSNYNYCFEDVKAEWFAPYICYAKQREWIQGYPDGFFRPETTVNKVEALKMLFMVYGENLQEGATVNSLPFSDTSTSAWYAIYIWRAVQLGILEESSNSAFNPSAGRSRGEMAEELYRYLIINDL